MSKIEKYLFICFMVVQALINAAELKTDFYSVDSIPKEYARTPSEGDLTVLTLEGLPKHSVVYVFEDRSFEQKSRALSAIKTGVRGAAQLCLYSLGFMPGFPIKYTFKDPNKELIKEITITPNRIYAESDVDHASIDATLISKSPATYKLTLDGFGNNEELIFTSFSLDETVEQQLKFSKQTTMLYMPEVIGKEGGMANLTFKRSSGEILSLDLPWGLEWVRYVLYYDKDGSVKTVLEDPAFLKDNPKIAEYFDFNSKPENGIHRIFVH